MRTLKHSILIMLLSVNFILYGQQRFSVEELIEIALMENLQNQISERQIRLAEFQKEGSVEFPKTEIFLENEDFSRTEPDGVWKLGVAQEIPWPGLNKSRKNYMDGLIAVHQTDSKAMKAEIVKEVRAAYFELWYLEEKNRLLIQLDSIYSRFVQTAEVAFNAGEVPALEKIAATVNHREITTLLLQNKQDIREQQQQLMLLTNKNMFFLPEEKPLIKLESEMSLSAESHPLLLAKEKEIEASELLKEVEKGNNRPDFYARFFSQSYLGIHNPVTGFEVSAAIPLFGGKARKNRLEALEEETRLQQTELQWEKSKLENRVRETEILLEREELMLEFYEEWGMEHVETIIAAATLGYNSGEISFTELSQYVTKAIDMKQNYLETLNSYNQLMIDYLYFTNQN